MADLECVLTSPEELVFEGKVRSVVVPAADGEMGILPRHAPLIGALSYGELRIEKDDGQKAHYFVQGGGFVEVLKNHVTVLATNVESVDAIRRDEAQSRLQELLDSSAPTGDLEATQARQEAVNVARRRLRLAR